MPVPKKRMSKSKTRMRRAHDALRAPSLGPCPQCDELKEPHRVCPMCGHYRGIQIVQVESEEEV
jgi:large subunit ribosomal protein L32